MCRLRIFAGPNGCGKSALYKQLEGRVKLGCYLNSDDLHPKLKKTLMVDLRDFQASAKQSEWFSFWENHGLYGQTPLLRDSRMENNILVLNGNPGSYEAAILTDFLRHCLLKTGHTFSFETVFSHPSKLDFMKEANRRQYKCYLYFAAVSSPDLCIARVRQRAREGGHDVPEDKIRKRYFLALENLAAALPLAHRAYLFDNSTDMKLVAEMTPNKNLEIKGKTIPFWLEENVLKLLKAR